MLSKLIRDPLHADQAKPLLERLKVLAATPRRRAPKPAPQPVVKTAPPCTERAQEVYTPIAEDMVTLPASQAVEDAPPAAIQEDIQIPVQSGPFAPTQKQIDSATSIGGRISWTCADCLASSLCREVQGRWVCRGCEGKLLEPPNSMSVLHHHATPPPEARANFVRQNEAVQRQQQVAEARAADHRAREEREQRQRDIANISRLTFADQAKILMP